MADFKTNVFITQCLFTVLGGDEDPMPLAIRALKLNGPFYFPDGTNSSTYRTIGEWESLGWDFFKCTMWANVTEAQRYFEYGFRSIVTIRPNSVCRVDYPQGSYVLLMGGETDSSRLTVEYYDINGDFLYRSQASHGFFPGFYYSSFETYNWSIDIGRVPVIGTTPCRINSIPGVSSSSAFIPAASACHSPLRFFATAPEINEDPYSPGGESETGGGDGEFINTSVPVSIPSLPSVSANDAGFIKLFVPSSIGLKGLASYMWTNSLFDVNTWKKIFADPMDAILGLSVVPVNVPVSSAPEEVKIGNLGTDIFFDVASTQYVEVNCGSLTLNEYWGSYLDYSPYTKIEIYLPYIGIRSISVDDVMNRTITLKYHVDILSGSCCAYLLCGDTVLYSFVGNCASSIPITGNDWTNVINGMVNVGASIGTTIATGGATAPSTVGTIASTAVNALKPTVERSGAMSGTGGLLGIQTPYIIITRPRQALPADLNTFTGYPVYLTADLTDITGYTEIDKIHLESIPATDAELNEIETLLRNGVIF